MKLTPKQKAFADYYIKLGNAEKTTVASKIERAERKLLQFRLSCVHSYGD
ncbi:Terminase small subunit [Seinonella peptonophila]|uniref:Terminase small subunit n=1 Tax=Seinonella peptonophila TaxID=112248 RepID=A0A1M4ZQW2_9BACL|nr:terminase small subunit [Seinonella peptonophila]SHF20388.1 Terminase small subunit [Seinonella peptonophila]